MIDFPASPTIGQQFTAAGVTWVWDGTKWAASGLSVAFLPLAGGNMSGPIVLAADPAANLQAATKQYVDGVRYGDNRIINGDMRIDQRNSGASGTANGYTVDRWQYVGSQAAKGTWGRNGGGSGQVGPALFPYCLGFASASAYVSLAADYFMFDQIIEADMVSDFAWGTANAQSVTLSFWAQSSLTGTFSGSVTNVAQNRSYPFTFSLPTANVWTKISVTIPGDTAGTWVRYGNAGSVVVWFDLGCGSTNRGPANTWAAAQYFGASGAVSVVGTNAANFFITGVKLEVGSVATPFNRQSLAKSMADCQRYYQRLGSRGTDIIMQGYTGAGGTPVAFSVGYPVTMRAAPTATQVGAWTITGVGTPLTYWPGLTSVGAGSSSTGAGSCQIYNTDNTGYISLSAEL